MPTSRNPESIRREVVTRIATNVANTLFELTPVIEDLILELLIDSDMTFEDIVRAVVKDCVDRQDLLRNLV